MLSYDLVNKGLSKIISWDGRSKKGKGDVFKFWGLRV